MVFEIAAALDLSGCEALPIHVRHAQTADFDIAGTSYAVAFVAFRWWVISPETRGKKQVTNI
jgi:hypothetical protein